MSCCGGLGALGVYNAGMFGLGDDGSFDPSSVTLASNDPNFDPTASLPNDGIVLPSTLPSGGGSPINVAGIINSLAAGAATGTKIYNATQTPSVIPGSNLAWNPATGAFTNASGLNLSTLGTTLGVSGGSGMLLLLGGGLLLVMMLAGKR